MIMVFKSLPERGCLTGQPLHHYHKAWRNRAWFKHAKKMSLKHFKSFRALTVKRWTNLCMLWGACCPAMSALAAVLQLCKVGLLPLRYHPAGGEREELQMEDPGVSAFKELRLKPHSAPKSLPHRFLCPEHLLVYFLELDTCFSNSALWGMPVIWPLSIQLPCLISQPLSQNSHLLN